MEQKEIIKLILEDKKKSNTYDRYPIRFLFMKLSETSEDEVIELITSLNSLSSEPENHINEIQYVNLHDLLSFEDGWITKSQLLNFITSLDPQKDYFITGFSELIRFYSRIDLEALIISFMTNIESVTQKNKQRIYFICYSLFDKIAAELKSNSRNESIDPIIKSSEIVDDDSEQICVYYASSNFDNKYFKNSIKTTTQWLSLYKAKTFNWSSGIVCISDTLVTLYEKAKPDNFVLIEKLDSNFKLLTNMFKFKLNYVEESMFNDDFWKKLFDDCFESSCFELTKIVKILLNVTNINSENFVELFLKSDLYSKRLLYLYLVENREDFDYEEYLISILDNSLSRDFSDFEKDIVSAVDMTKEKVYFKARKYFINKLNPEDVESLIEYFVKALNNAFFSFLETQIFNAKVTFDNLLDFSIDELSVKYKVSAQYMRTICRSFYDEFLSNVLLCNTLDEKKIIMLLLQNKVIELQNAMQLYPALFSYLGTDTSTKISNSLQWIAAYLYKYRLSKIFDAPTSGYDELCSQFASSFPKWFIDKNLSPVFESLNKEKYDVLIVLDGIGAEYFEYLLSLIKEKNKVINYANICKCFLPSITDVNRNQYLGKYDEWIADFDKENIHGMFYHAEEYLPKALDKIKQLIDKIIIKYSGKRVAIIADHGATAAGKIMRCLKKYDYMCEHEGRCAMVDSFNDIADSDTNDYYKFESSYDEQKWLLSLNGCSLGDNPKRESHGGATIEEVTVPCIIFSDCDDAVINYSIELLSSSVSGLDRSITIEVLPHLESNPILEEESGKRHVMTMAGNNIWKCDVEDVRTQNINIIINDQKTSLTIKGTMGATIGDDGFDD